MLAPYDCPSPNIQLKEFHNIANILARTDDPKDVEAFLFDLTTEVEREEFARRFEVAEMLNE